MNNNIDSEPPFETSFKLAINRPEKPKEEKILTGRGHVVKMTQVNKNKNANKQKKNYNF